MADLIQKGIIYQSIVEWGGKINENVHYTFVRTFKLIQKTTKHLEIRKKNKRYERLMSSSGSKN